MAILYEFLILPRVFDGAAVDLVNRVVDVYRVEGDLIGAYPLKGT